MCARNDVDKKNMETINRILEKYPNELNLYINSLSRKTTYTKLVYVRYVSKFLDYMNTRLRLDPFKINNFKRIKPMHIDSFMEHIRYDKNGKENSGTYRNAHLAAIKGFFKFLYLNDIVKSNPCDNIEAPKDNKEHEIITITDEDLDIIIDCIQNGIGTVKAKSTQEKWINRDMAIIYLGITTGLRIGAIVGINVDDVDFKEKTITITEKGNIEKKVYIGDKTIYYLNKWLRDRRYMANPSEPALFICQGNHRISVRSIENKFKALSQVVGKNLTPHKMRATCATRLYEETGDIYLVQQQLGHKSINNTQRYARVSEQKRREAADILNNLI